MSKRDPNIPKPLKVVLPGIWARTYLYGLWLEYRMGRSFISMWGPEVGLWQSQAVYLHLQVTSSVNPVWSENFLLGYHDVMLHDLGNSGSLMDRWWQLNFSRRWRTKAPMLAEPEISKAVTSDSFMYDWTLLLPGTTAILDSWSHGARKGVKDH
jgi:hypothetical protein